MKHFWEKYKLAFYVLRHPFDGFYMMKYEKKGSLGVAFLNFILFWISYSFMGQYASLIVDQSHPLQQNSLIDGISILSVLVLFSLANWSVTSLTNGEGKFKEIIMANCYALTPLILSFIPITLISNVLAEGEGAFYFLVINFAVMWFVFLAFAGMIMIHNFSAGKAVATVFLTFIALLIIVFLIALMFMLWQQMIVFFRSIYMEIVFRY